MHIIDKNFNEILSYEIISIIGSLLAGIFLAAYTDKLLLLPGIFILIPGFLEMRGNISGSFASRISSGLFLGVIKPNKFNTKIIRGNLIASFLMAILVSFVLGIILFLFNYFIFNIYIPKIILLPLIAGIIASIIEIPLVLIITFHLFKRGHDPNNIIGPLVTSTGDISSIISLIIALVII